ncbi:4-alpha-glucanotransferase [Magnetovibrio blakemorei]|uniref:4-alpha-glucanotransferase n=1 Tax=Magnetovibrio blakemorei TaxID=28181 RepID=A0A1E5Q649_9PROT|nr:4-alpha-glucanotransferase [Magnetovibrio blakemorei]OEJ66218.1 4-alpha-glucanotransferase [Magnetovibrio blakemorei]
MVDHNQLHRLADLAGIELDYWEVNGQHHETSDDTRRAILAAVGYPANTDLELTDSLARIEEGPWRRGLEPITALRVGQQCPQPAVTVTVRERDADGTLAWFLDCEDGQTFEGSVLASALPVIERRTIDGDVYLRLSLSMPDDVAYGYHTLRVKTDALKASSTLVVAPPSGYRPDWMPKDGVGGRRVWGVACQLYALRGANDWGIGDFGDLGAFCDEVAKWGGSAVGLSPLHALFLCQTERTSPYSPSSRTFLNPLYIDVTAVPEWPDVAGDLDFSARIQAVQSGDQVAYGEVAALKTEALAHLFARFEKAHPANSGSPRRLAFEAFVALSGRPLQQYALFEAVQEHFAATPVHAWPLEYKDPNSDACAAFAAEHATRVSFFAYLQWEADRQLALAAARCDDNDMAIGLYRDMAVGVTVDGADAWIDGDAYMDGVNIGAPPDPIAPAGQDWGLPPFNPLRLRELGYAPYIQMLRANMRHAGAIRVDHIMWMQKIFCIPRGKDGREGAYIRFPKNDLFAILALESHRNRCLIVGEDLGTVPEGFRERMEAEGILSYRLLHFQRYADGLFYRPETYPKLSLTTAASHDFPTLAGYWSGEDLLMLADIGLIANDEELKARQAQRARDRELLVAALIDQQLLAKDFPQTPDGADVKALINAIHRFLARSPAALMMVNLEDIIGTTRQINVPGTVDQYPNWSGRIEIDIDRLSGPDQVAAAALVEAERS